jgi:hypothetical protein
VIGEVVGANVVGPRVAKGLPFRQTQTNRFFAQHPISTSS